MGFLMRLQMFRYRILALRSPLLLNECKTTIGFLLPVVLLPPTTVGLAVAMFGALRQRDCRVKNT